MKTREQNRSNKQTEKEPFEIGLSGGYIQTCVAFGWLSERLGEITSDTRTF